MIDDPGPIPADLYDDPPFDEDTFERTVDALLAAADDGGHSPDGDLAQGLLLDGDNEISAHHLVPDEARRWRIVDDRQAEWVARKYAAAQAERDAAVERRSEWAGEIDRWLKRATRRALGTMAWAGALLGDYALRQREETGGQRKTVVLPSGDVGTRSKPPRPVVAKEDEFLPWAAEHAPELVRTPPPEPALGEFKKRLGIDPARVVAVDHEIVLECGHAIVVRLRSEFLEAPTIESLADGGWECPEDDCEDDLIAGRTRTVTDHRIVGDVREAVVVDLATGEVVPGLAVAPEEITPTIKIGGR